MTFDPSDLITFTVIAFVAQPLCVAWFLSLLVRIG